MLDKLIQKKGGGQKTNKTKNHRVYKFCINLQKKGEIFQCLLSCLLTLEEEDSLWRVNDHSSVWALSPPCELWLSLASQVRLHSILSLRNENSVKETVTTFLQHLCQSICLYQKKPCVCKIWRFIVHINFYFKKSQHINTFSCFSSPPPQPHN